MSEKDIAELQNLTVAEIVEQAPGLNAAQLAELRRLETEDGKAEGRKGVIAAIDEAEAALALAPASLKLDADARVVGVTKPPAGKLKLADKPPKAEAAANPVKAPAWQAADYNGPITIDQANWRRENVKPVRQASTK